MARNPFKKPWCLGWNKDGWVWPASGPRGLANESRPGWGGGRRSSCLPQRLLGALGYQGWGEGPGRGWGLLLAQMPLQNGQMTFWRPPLAGPWFVKLSPPLPAFPCSLCCLCGFVSSSVCLFSPFLSPSVCFPCIFPPALPSTLNGLAFLSIVFISSPSSPSCALFCSPPCLAGPLPLLSSCLTSSFFPLPSSQPLPPHPPACRASPAARYG